MKLSQFKSVLALNQSKNLRFTLPTGTRLPPHAHVTEVARIDKRFIDCGGTFRTEVTCRLQTWFADDTDHRLTAGKLLAILDKSAGFLEGDEMELDVECEAPFVSQFPVASVDLEGSFVNVRLDLRHTACLAEDKCLPPKPGKRQVSYVGMPTLSQAKCC